MIGRMRGLLVLLLVGCMAAPAAAQDTPAVFLHGFKGSGEDWGPTAIRLSQSIAIMPHTPSLDWTRPFTEQAADLQSRSDPGSLPSSLIVVGHSNGGLVARTWAQMRSMAGIATIGTPHQGAPLMPHFTAFANFMSVGPAIVSEALSAFSVVSDWSWIIAVLPNAFHFTSDYSLWSIFYLAATIGVDVGLPVAFDMGPGSPFLQQLNSGANLAHEASAAPARVGIVSVAHNFYYAGPARAIAPDAADDIANAVYGIASGLIYWGGYIQSHADPTDMAATTQSLALLNAAGYLFSIDPFYCAMVSRADGSQCLPNDGVVPYDSQTFPNAVNIVIGANNDGPAHIQERDHADDALYQAIVWYLHVPARSTEPAPVPSPLPPPSQQVASDTTDPAPPPDSDTQSSSGSSSSTGGGGSGVLESGQQLYAGQVIQSGDGRFDLSYQYDGNLVLYDNTGTPIWATGTYGTDPGSASMQGDGNFVVYNASGTPIWATNTFQAGASLSVQSDGNVVVYAPNGTPVWASNTAGR